MTKIAYALSAGLLLVLALPGCEREDPNAVAAAKCSFPLGQRIGAPDDRPVQTSDVRVRDLGEGRREVTGLVARPDAVRLASFVCVVTPDASDQLRGLRVERLDVR